MKHLAIGISVIAALLLLVGGVAATQLPAIGAGALLFPSRHVNLRARPAGCVDRTFAGDGLTRDGWQCRSTAADHHGTVIYLHGVADNRGSGVSAIERFVRVIDQLDGPVKAAEKISVPVLLIHGAADVDTLLVHSEKVYQALRSPKQLVIVPAAGHNDVLRSEVWAQVEKWVLALPK